MGTGLDLLVIGNCVLYKEKQKNALAENYKDKYKKD
jgi:carbamoyltransferase